MLYLVGLFVDVDVISSFNLFGLAEEDEILEQENVTKVFLASAPNNELILTAKLALLLQIDLSTQHRKSLKSGHSVGFLTVI